MATLIRRETASAVQVVAGESPVSRGQKGECLDDPNTCFDGEVVDEVRWQYVGEGRGGYSKVPVYNYVGEGLGSFHKDESLDIANTGRWNDRTCCLGAMIFLSGLTIVCFAGFAQSGELDKFIEKYADRARTGPNASSNETNTSAPSNVTHHRARADRSHSTSSSPYDCAAGFTNWETGWPLLKKDYCCEHENRGCPPESANGPSSTFDCDADLENAKTEWTVFKKRWCCHHKKVGCDDAKISTKYNCTAASQPTPPDVNQVQLYSSVVRTAWSNHQKHWCCVNAHVGCPETTSSEPYDCDASFANWQNVWSKMKAQWCCRHYERGCSREQSGSKSAKKFDCVEGFAEWQMLWSEEKAAYCCKNFQRGCRTTTTSALFNSETIMYNCDVRLVSDVAQWSERQRHFCCQTSGNGCVATTLEPFDCAAGLNNFGKDWSTKKKRWCCRTYGRGCPNQQSKSVQHADLGCDARCVLNGQSKTCRDRIQWTATNLLASTLTPCELALGHVLEECEACSVCSLTESQCKMPAKA